MTCGTVSSAENENGLRGMSGDRGLSAFANKSSPDSAFPPLPMGFIDKEANPCSCCCWDCTYSGGAWATACLGAAGWFREDKFEDVVLWKELNEDMATSGSSGDRGWRFGSDWEVAGYRVANQHAFPISISLVGAIDEIEHTCIPIPR